MEPRLGPTVPPAGSGVIDLADERALDPVLAGAKASALARSAAAGLPVLPGFVIPTSFDHEAVSLTALRPAWAVLSSQGATPLVVRSSSTAEDGAESSMAGRFHSVVGVLDWDDFVAAVTEVHGSAHGARAVGGSVGAMAILVQPELDAAIGGVMFGRDPVTGLDRVVISVVEGGPERLVSGEVDGRRFVLGAGGRVLEGGSASDLGLGVVPRRALVRLAKAAAATFGGPQDMEWGIDRAGKLWLFQSRPITATNEARRGRGAVYGPGPLAETFPHPLAPLEEDLWFEPMSTAVTEAFRITGAASARVLRTRPMVRTIAGRAAADLEMFGYRKARSGFVSRLDPRGPLRRLSRSWTVGRLRAALPSLAVDLLDRSDQQLAGVPSLRTLSDEQLLRVLENSTQMLVALHGYEVLVGALTAQDEAATSAGAIALRALAEGRLEGLDDDAIVQKLPWVLALVPPSLEPSVLPDSGSVLTLPEAQGDETPSLRENLRMRVRWVQELTARAVRVLAGRLEERGVVGDAVSVALMDLAELRRAVDESAIPDDLHDRVRLDEPPLPSAFRFADDGVPVAESSDGGGAVPGGGGRVDGTACDPSDPSSGDVLVARTLDPDLAPLLGGMKAIVAETGSPLSHLAILAREMGLAVVLGVADATTVFPPGTHLLVDGSTGEVRSLDAALEVSA